MRFILLLLAASCLAGAAHAQDAGALLDANRAAAHGEALAGKGSAELTYAYSGQGMTGVTRTVYDVASGAFVDSNEVGPTTGANGFDGHDAWMRDLSKATTPQAGGDTHQLAVNEAYRDANLWWRADRDGAGVTALGSKTDEGKPYEVVSITPVGGKTFQAWFDPKTHLLARTVEMQGFQPITTFFSDYRPVDGVMIAGKQLIDDGTGVQYRQTQTLTQAAFTAPRPASAYAIPPMRRDDARIANGEGRVTVPFELLNNHIYAKVRVNGKGPFTFIFDTGGHDILTPDTAKLLAVKSEGQGAGTGVGTEVVDVSFAKGVTLSIGDLTLKDQAVTVLPFEEGPVEGFNEQGMIGFEMFRRFVTRVDYGAKTLTFIDPSRFTTADAAEAGTPVPFVFYNHLPQVQGAIYGAPGRFDIDTGSRVELTLTAPFVDQNGLLAKHPNGVTAVDGWGVGGRSRSYITRAPDLELGPVQVDNLVVGMSRQKNGSFADPNFVGNVGSGLLKRFVVTLDYDHQIMYLKPLPAPVPDSGVFDRSGMWINMSPAGFKVMDVTDGGPAAAAGLKLGDEIVAVDGKPSSDIALSDFRKRLRDDQPGTQVALTVASGGQKRPVTLVLKDQI